MSLKHVHLIFITVSSVLLAFMGWWAFTQFQQNQNNIYLLSTLACAALSIVIAIYGVSFFKKINTQRL